MSYYEAYCGYWHDFVDIYTACHDKGMLKMHHTPESLLLPCGPELVILLLSWYGENLNFMWRKNFL